MRFKVVLLLALFLLPAFASPKWWNSSWDYRTCFNVTSPKYERTDWPVEYPLNLTEELISSGGSGAIDFASLRLAEHNTTSGQTFGIRTSQFDTTPGFDTSDNFYGTLVFLLNGTTDADDTRTYCLYYDTDAKSPSNPANISYVWDGDELNVNVSIYDGSAKGLRYWIDTNRSTNMSGLYRMEDFGNNNFWSVPGEDEVPTEYSLYSNETHNLTFHLVGNMTVVHEGPIRLVFEQKGPEVFWNSTNQTGLEVTKRYIFYNQSQWIKVEQEIKNTAEFNITRNSTLAGALALETRRGTYEHVIQGNATNPGSWYWFAQEFASFHMGVVSFNQSGNFTAVDRNSSVGKGGIELSNMTLIEPNQTIYSKAALHFNGPQAIHGSPTAPQVRDLSRNLVNPGVTTKIFSEKWIVTLNTTTNYSDYNHGENVTVEVNVTADSGLVDSLNASVESDGGGFVMDLYDDGTNGDQSAGDGVYTNWFYINETNSTGTWNITAYAWDNETNLLNTSLKQISVWDTYTADLNVINFYGFIDRAVNSTLTLTNYRDDSYIAGASVNCSYNETYAGENTTDYGNGTYFIEFLAPSYFGNFTLVCNATKLNNTGQGINTFMAVEYVTEMEVELNYSTLSSIDNVTLLFGQNFTLRAISTNLGNGTSYDGNVTVFVPENWTLNTSIDYLPELNVSNTFPLYFEVGVPANSTPGIYSINATLEWKNADNTTDLFNVTFNATVDPNPDVEIFEEDMNVTVTPGQWNDIGNITIMSHGNADLENVTFNDTGIPTMNFSFVPESINLSIGENYSVLVQIWLPYDHERGVFNGTINASAENDDFDLANLQVTILETYMSVQADPDNVTSDQMGWFDFQNFTVFVNTTNIGTSDAIAANISLNFPESNWTTNFTNDIFSCGDVSPGDNCSVVFDMAVMGSTPGNYTVYANVSWINLGVGLSSNTTNISVEVLSNPEIEADPDYLAGNMSHGKESVLGNVTVRNVGNAVISGINMNVYDLNDFTIEFDPTVSSLELGEVKNVTLNVTVPIGYDSGDYLGTLNITTSGAGFDSVFLNITVPFEANWNMTPENCTQYVAYDEGVVCNVTVENYGNVDLNFTLIPIVENFTYTNVTNFTLLRLNTTVFSVNWNLTGQPKDFYNSTYNVSTDLGSPPWRYLNTSMIPIELAEVNASISANITRALDPIVIYANVTDKSMQGLNETKVIAFRPDGILQENPLSLDEIDNNTYKYHLNIPGGSINTNATGNYTFQVFVKDMLGLITRKNLTAYIYPRITTDLQTGFSTYFAGETASLYINVTDAALVPIPTNTTVRIYDPRGYLHYIGDFKPNGTVLPIIDFTVPSDTELGDYSIKVNATHYDSVANTTTNGTDTYTLTVREEYEVEFDVSYVWYAAQPIQGNFFALVYTDRAFTPPDSILLNVYDSADNLYFSLSNPTTLNTTSNSILYKFNYSLPSTDGYYLAELIVEEGGREVRRLKAFRVSFGGPYDVDITEIEDEVPQGDDLDFTVLLENYGDIDQDVFLSYWIQNTTNHTFSYVLNRPTYVPARGNRSLNLSLGIGSNQSVGDYELHVQLNYSPIYPVLTVVRSFEVVAAEEEEEEEEEPEIIEPVVAAVIEMAITNIFPEEMILNRGSVGYVTIEVKNTGSVKLTDLTVFFEDIERDWFEIVREVDSLSPGGSGYLIVKFDIPSDASARTYVAKMRIISKEVEVSEFYKVIVYRTQEEALRAKIAALRETVTELEDQTGAMAAKGADVTKILSLLRKARELLDVAEIYLEEDETVDAIKTISEVETVVEEIRYRLEILRPGPLPSVTIPEIPPDWYFMGAVLLALALLGVYLGRKFMRYRSEERRKTLTKVKSVVAMREEAAAEGDVIETLKKQYEEGLLSRETFEELLGLLK